MAEGNGVAECRGIGLGDWRSEARWVRSRGCVALVTDAGREIGAGIAQRFAAEGAVVAVTARGLDPHSHLPGTLVETARCIE